MKMLNFWLLVLLESLVLCDKEKIYGPFNELEYKEMNEEVNNVVNFINYHNITNTPGNHTDSLICKTCLYTFNKFHQLLDKKYGLRLFEELIARICSIGLEYEVCKKAIGLYAPVVIDSLIEHYLDAEYICTYRFICQFDHYVKLNPDDYARRLLQDKPTNIIPDVDLLAPILKVLHVTDIHTDLKYEEVK
jgi:hypothetical protein